MAVYRKQAPKGVRLKWAPLKEARYVTFSRDTVQGTWVLQSSELAPTVKSLDAKHSTKKSPNKNYLIP